LLERSDIHEVVQHRDVHRDHTFKAVTCEKLH